MGLLTLAGISHILLICTAPSIRLFLQRILPVGTYSPFLCGFLCYNIALALNAPPIKANNYHFHYIRLNEFVQYQIPDYTLQKEWDYEFFYQSQLYVRFLCFVTVC